MSEISHRLGQIGLIDESYAHAKVLKEYRAGLGKEKQLFERLLAMSDSKEEVMLERTKVC